MTSSWEEYISDFGGEFDAYIDDYGRFFWAETTDSLRNYSNRGALILGTEIRNRYTIFAQPLIFTQSGYGLQYDGITIEVSHNVSDGYLISVSIIFPNNYSFYSATLGIPSTLEAYRENGIKFFDGVMFAISRIPFIELTGDYISLTSAINSMRKFIPPDIPLDTELDILQLVNIILSTSFAIDKL